jgi:hypothetical protein
MPQIDLTTTQVSNCSNAIKIARDFISIDTLSHSERLISEFREQRLSTGSGDDVLQLYNTLWHLWMSLSQQTPLVRDSINIADYDSAGSHAMNDLIHSGLGDLTPAFDSSSDLVMDDLASSSFLGPNHMQGENPADATPSASVLRRRAKNRASKLQRKLAQPSLPEHRFTCLLCPRKFHRGGFFDHL